MLDVQALEGFRPTGEASFRLLIRLRQDSKKPLIGLTPVLAGVVWDFRGRSNGSLFWWRLDFAQAATGSTDDPTDIAI